MRRARQQLSHEDAEAILLNNTHGILAVSGDDDYPYAVPVSYVYCEGKIYFHCATSGHKLDAIQRNAKVSFCVVDQDQVVAESFTTFYRSAIAFGRTRILTDDVEKREAIRLLAAKYSPAYLDQADRVIERGWSAFCMVEIAVEHLTGKVARELLTG